ncbi:MAG: MBL fold metallo-hydrolase [Desulfurella sp.]|uniref:MBL fold metallo-hydrolase n=1 Tax=Desulfurella sp. TaxID=1962857 RepID=UPI003D0DE673
MDRHTLDTPYPVGPVHFYTCELSGDIIMFDTGPYTFVALDYIKKNINLNRLKYVFITHSHADHYGLENFIAKNSQARIFMPKMDHLKFTNLQTRIEISKKLLLKYGFSTDYIEKIKIMLLNFVNSVPLPINYEILEESKFDIDLNYMFCPGHSKSDAVYLFNGYAITGDCLLNNIFQTPLLDVDYDKNDRFNNYEAYCSTLLKFPILEKYTILPGHRKHSSIEEIVVFYVTKIIERASLIQDHCDKLVFDIIKNTIPYALNDPFTAYIKASEVLFFLDFLLNPYLLKESLEKINIIDSRLLRMFDRIFLKKVYQKN